MQVAIRRILVSCWVDITMVSVRATNGNVYLSGTLQRMTQDHREMLSGQLKRLDLSIRSVRGVRNVYYNFNNLSYSIYGTWTPSQVKTFEINDPPPADLPPKTAE